MPVKVSIITVYYNTPTELLRLSASIRKWLPEKDWEWIVVDNHSEQDLSEQIPHACYLRMPDNLGFAKGCNAGARRASGQVLFFVNPDCEMVQDCITPLLGELNDHEIVAPQVLNDDATIQLSFGPFLSIAAELKQMLLMKFEKTRLVQTRLRRQMSQPFRTDYVSGCALMIQADLFHKVGGFDEHFFLYEEDIDLCKRAGDKRVACIPEARILHSRNRSTKNQRSRAAAEYRKSQMYYYRKHQSTFQQLLLQLYLTVRFLLDREMIRLIWSKSAETAS